MIPRPQHTKATAATENLVHPTVTESKVQNVDNVDIVFENCVLESEDFEVVTEFNISELPTISLDEIVQNDVESNEIIMNQVNAETSIMEVVPTPFKRAFFWKD